MDPTPSTIKALLVPMYTNQEQMQLDKIWCDSFITIFSPGMSILRMFSTVSSRVIHCVSMLSFPWSTTTRFDPTLSSFHFISHPWPWPCVNIHLLLFWRKLWFVLSLFFLKINYVWNHFTSTLYTLNSLSKAPTEWKTNSVNNSTRAMSNFLFIYINSECVMQVL
jgi:hypothetical protein